MTSNIEQARSLIIEQGYKDITQVPKHLYDAVLQEIPAGCRIAINNGTENLIVLTAEGRGRCAITPVDE